MNNDAPQGIEAQSGETGTGSIRQDESPARAAGAQNLSSSSPEGLQEPALREALEPFARIGELIELETTGFDDADELHLIIESGHLLERIKVGDFRRAHAALSTLPQQAATDDGEKPCCHEWYQGRCVHCAIDVRDYRKRPTPTSQPPAETRLRRALEKIAQPSEYMSAQQCQAAAYEALAALTQPEPTAPQGGEEERAAELIRSYFDARQAGNDCPECGNEGPWEHCGPCSDRIGPVIARMSNFAINMDMHGEIAEGADKRDAVARIISLAKGAPENGQMSIGAWWWDKRHDRARPEHFEGECRDEDRKHADLMIPLLRAALSAQQAAGEAEVVAWMYQQGKRIEIFPFEVDDNSIFKGQGWTETLLYATPQPTETQRIVAATSSAEFHQRRGMLADVILAALHEYDEWMRDDRYDYNVALNKVIAQLERARGVVTPAGGEHLAGEGQ